MGPNASPKLIAHRGFAADHPENTLRAFERASEVADGIEVDVRRCGSGELVAIHDETLSRVANRALRVSETSLADLRGLPIGGTDATIPTIAEVFDAVPSDVFVILDLKERGLVADANAIREANDHDVCFAAFEPSTLEQARRVDSTTPTALAVRESALNRPLRPLVSRLPGWCYWPENVGGTVDRAVGLGCAAIHPRYELCLRTDMVERAHAAGLDVAAWTISDGHVFEIVARTGVDAIIADAPPARSDRSPRIDSRGGRTSE